ncbi:MAG: mannose-1-phosphate guanylyltransferase [Omnitrophica bacterium]|nr:mannose-1-phosphate guanylyltransferase [Candidatus Omnitrophota bacterium]
MAKTESDVYAVLLAGGKGTRLWPLSTPDRSKSFIRIGKRRPLIEESRKRLHGLIPDKNLIIVVDKTQERLVRSLVRGVPKKNILVEPFGRSTASAAGLAAIELKDEDIMAVLPTDALIEDGNAFRKTLKEAIRFVRAKDGVIMSVGITPTAPSTAYGYVKLRSRIKGKIYSVNKFIEKPSGRLAAALIKRRDSAWNAGIFIFKAKDFLNACRSHAPVLYRELLRIKKNKREKPASYRRMKNISIDYQIMEKAKNLYCVKGTFCWRDLGNWRSAMEVLKKDKNGNAVFGKVNLVDTRNSIVYNTQKSTLGVIGLADTIVVSTKNGTLVCAKKDAEKVKELAGLE